MIDERNLLERALHHFEPQPGLTERIYRRREQKRRNQRIRAGALAIVLALVSFVALARAFRSAELRGADAEAGSRDRGRPRVRGRRRHLRGRLGRFEPGPDRGRPSPQRLARRRWHRRILGREGPIWSPDGRYLAYRHADCEGARDAWWDVVISDPEGNVVASFPSEGWGISWSPDSTRVAVWVRWGETIGVYGLDGERQTLLTVPPG